MGDSERKLLTVVMNDEEAVLIAGALDAHGIEVFIDSKTFKQEPVRFGLLGDVRLYVDAADAERAEALLAELQQGKGDAPELRVGARRSGRGRRRRRSGRMSEDPSYLGRYRIVSRIGAGAMGDVFLAEDPQIDRRLAIKTVKLHGSAEEVETRKQRMLVEARAAGRIVHPHAVTLFDAGEDAGTVFLAFEFVEGQDLGVKLKGGEPITLREALTIVRQTADALHHAHQLGIVHRDIKPSNIMLTGSGSAKIGDFGIAKVHNQQTELTTTGMLVGTPHYMSPEQVRGETLDGRSDVFSLGSVLFELLHRRRPFPSDTLTTLVYQILHEDPTQDLRANLPAGVGELVRGMLEKDFRKRLDARQVSEKLTGLLSDLSADQLAHDASTVEGVTAPGGAPPAPGPQHRPATTPSRRRLDRRPAHGSDAVHRRLRDPGSGRFGSCSCRSESAPLAALGGRRGLRRHSGARRGRGRPFCSVWARTGDAEHGGADPGLRPGCGPRSRRAGSRRCRLGPRRRHRRDGPRGG